MPDQATYKQKSGTRMSQKSVASIMQKWSLTKPLQFTSRTKDLLRKATIYF
jgi:hypothetical protein